MNDITISKCGTCGQDMRPTDYTERHQQVLEAKDKEIATMRYENAIRFGTSHPEMYKTELDEAKETLKDHGEIQADLCKEITKYKALCDQMAKEMEAAIPSLEIHFDAYFEALAKYKEMK